MYSVIFTEFTENYNQTIFALLPPKLSMRLQADGPWCPEELFDVILNMQPIFVFKPTNLILLNTYKPFRYVRFLVSTIC